MVSSQHGVIHTLCLSIQYGDFMRFDVGLESCCKEVKKRKRQEMESEKVICNSDLLAS